MANKNLSGWADTERLQKKVKKLTEAAWKEMNMVSSNDQKYTSRAKVWKSFYNLFIELGGDHNTLEYIF